VTRPTGTSIPPATAATREACQPCISRRARTGARPFGLAAPSSLGMRGRSPGNSLLHIAVRHIGRVRSGPPVRQSCGGRFAFGTLATSAETALSVAAPLHPECALEAVTPSVAASTRPAPVVAAVDGATHEATPRMSGPERQADARFARRGMEARFSRQGHRPRLCRSRRVPRPRPG
jgi:hypothetical protein